MNEKYIQAIILGSIIGLAIILDDFIGPKPGRSMERHVMMVDGKNKPHQMKDQWKAKDGKAIDLHELEDHNVMIFKTDDDGVEKKIQIKIDAGDIESIDIDKILDTLKSDLSEDDLNAIKAKIKSSKMKLSESKHGLKEIEVEVEVL
jgi:hypothetical protein